MRDFNSNHLPTPRRRKIQPGKRHLAAAGSAGVLGIMLMAFMTPSDAGMETASKHRHGKARDHSEYPRRGARLRIDLTLPETKRPIRPAARVDTTTTVNIAPGDTLSGIFKRLKILNELPEILRADKAAQTLSSIRPGETLSLRMKDGRIKGIHYRSHAGVELIISRVADRYRVNSFDIQYEHRRLLANGGIQNSLFVDAQRAGLSDRLIMQLAEIFAWDIDFALDLRPGDRFTVIYEALYEDGVRVREGNIVAAEFINRGRTFHAIRYTDASGRTDYYTPDGRSLRKTFLRNPVQFTRISSRFNPQRKHPILNRIRAHTGVDYAAPTGTPIRAAGDGKVIFKGWKGGYGQFVVLQHGRGYSTAYGHLSAYADKLKIGQPVKQGQVIGYVGKSGLATGPHLHYEFRINGEHRDPLKVSLPAAPPLDARYLADFEAKGLPLLAQIHSYQLAARNRLGDS